MFDLHDRHARIDGVRLHWTELGLDRGLAPPLLMMHGLFDSSLTFRHVAAALSQDRLVLLPDLPGHGLSEQPTSSSPPDRCGRVMAQMLALLDRVQVDLLGHSFGGTVAQMLVRECPAKVRRLVLVAAPALPKSASPELHLEKPWLDEQPAQSVAHWVWEVLRPPPSLLDDVGSRPIAVLWGTRDRIVPFAEGKRLSAGMAGATFVPFEGCGHYLHHDEPARFVEVVREFLSTPCTPARVSDHDHGARRASTYATA